MSIEIGSKWIKDGEVVEVKQVSEILNDNLYYSVIWFSSLTENYKKILTKYDFLEQYKPYEVVYEWEFVAQQPNWYRHFTNFMTEKEMEHFSFQHDCAYYQRLDFTKRERKQ